MFRTQYYGNNILPFQFMEFFLKVSLEISFIKCFLIFNVAHDFAFDNILVTLNIGKWSDMSALTMSISTFK